MAASRKRALREWDARLGAALCTFASALSTTCTCPAGVLACPACGWARDGVAVARAPREPARALVEALLERAPTSSRARGAKLVDGRVSVRIDVSEASRGALERIARRFLASAYSRENGLRLPPLPEGPAEVSLEFLSLTPGSRTQAWHVDCGECALGVALIIPLRDTVRTTEWLVASHDARAWAAAGGAERARVFSAALEAGDVAAFPRYTTHRGVADGSTREAVYASVTWPGTRAHPTPRPSPIAALPANLAACQHQHGIVDFGCSGPRS